MRAIVRDIYGTPAVLRVAERPRPIPGPGQLLIRVSASSLNRADWYCLLGIPAPLRLVTGLRRPNVPGLGIDFAGEVVSVGPAGARSQSLSESPFAIGQRVFGECPFGETWAEYACVNADTTAAIPEGISDAEAAAVPLAGCTALQALRDHGRLGPGQSVLINGATGSVGSFAVQIAKALGAEVTAVCSERHAALVRELGADAVIAYEREDFTACGRRFDVMFDGVMNRPLRACRRVLERRGTYLPVGGPEGRWLGPVPALLGALVRGLFVPQRVASVSAEPRRADLETLGEWLRTGVIRSAIDRRFDLDDTAAALEYLREVRPGSKVVLELA